ncbi:MAG: hypothetical protein D0530_07085, partial [Methylococcales bacterium]
MINYRNRQKPSYSMMLALEPRMVFDGAVAVPDTAAIVADAAHVTGNVLSDGTPHDTGTGTLNVQGVASGSTTAPLNTGVNTTVNGLYGSLDIQANGSYDYSLNTSAANVMALRAGQHATDTFTYTMIDSANTTATTTLTVNITGINDAPTAIADTNTIAANVASISTTNLTGVLANDTDPDTGDTKTVSAISTSGNTAGTVGTALTGTYGSVTLNADGSYTYALNTSNATVQALAAGHTLTDSFNYTMKDSGNLSSSSTLSITIDGINTAPVLTPATVTLSQLEDTSTYTASGTANTFGTISFTNTPISHTVSDLLLAPDTTPMWTDINATADGIAITAAPTTDATSHMTGVWSYQLNGSTTWTAFPTVDATHALLLPSNAKIEYIVTDSSSTESQNAGSVSLTYTVWDGSTGTAGTVVNPGSVGGTSAFATGSVTAAMNVTPVNQVPIFNSTPLSVNEHTTANLTGSFTSDSTQLGSLTGNLQLYDGDNTTTQILYRVEQLPINGTLTLNGATLGVGSLFSQADVSNIKYTPTVAELSANTTDSVYFTIRDGAGGIIGIDAPAGTTANIASWAKLDINILDVNAPISITGTSVSIAEDNAHPNSAVIAPIAISLSDADDPNNLRTLTLTSLPTATFGSLQYWNGSSYQTATIGLTFTQAQLTDLSHPALQFVYNNTTEPTNQNGVLMADQSQTSFTVSASDNNGHLTASTATATITVNITPVNDAPALTTTTLTVNQGSANNVITGDASGNILYVTDPDSNPVNRVYTIVTDATLGYLTLNGVRIGRGSTFTESDLTTGKLQYNTNDPYSYGTDSISLGVTDGNGGSSGTQTLSIFILQTSNSNPTPTLGMSDGNGNNAGIVGTLAGVTPEGLFLTLNETILNDAGTGTTATEYTINVKPSYGNVYLKGVELNYGVTTFTQTDINNGNVTYVNNGSSPSSYSTPNIDTLTITATKGSSSVSHALDITVTPVDKAPTITQTVSSVSTNQDGSALMQQVVGNATYGMATANFALSGVLNAVKLTSDNFTAIDLDNTQSQLTYIVSNAVGGSIATWNGTNWVAATSFTADLLTSGNVAYFHNPSTDVSSPGNTHITDSISVHLIDGGIVGTGDLQTSTTAPYFIESSTLTNQTIHLAKGSQMISPTQTLNFTVTNVNNAPIASNTNFTVTEYSSGYGVTPLSSNIQILNASVLSVTDADTANSSWTYTLTALPTYGNLQKLVSGTWTNITATDLNSHDALSQFTYTDLSVGNLRYVNTGNIVIGNSNWTLAQDSFKYTVNDGEAVSVPLNLTSNEATVSVFLRPTNQPPVIVNTGPGTTPQGGALEITSALLGSPTTTLVDPDNSNVQVQYRITSNVTNGTIYLGTLGGAVVKQLSVGSAFTLADIQNGLIWYQNNGNDPAGYSTAFTDTFHYVVSDASGMTEPAGTFNINILPVNKAPVVTGLLGGATFTEGGTVAVPVALPLLIDSSVVLTDADITDSHLANASASFLNGSLTISDGFSGDKTYDQLSIQNTGAGASAIVYSANTGFITYGGTQIGSVDTTTNNGVNGNSLSISLNASANIAAVQALMQAITFNHSNYDNAVVGTRTLTYTLIDGGGTSSSTNINGNNYSGTSYTDSKNVAFPGNATWTGTATINVVSANDRPILTVNTSGNPITLGTITEDNTTPPAILVSSFISTVNGSATSTTTGISDVDTSAVNGIAITGLTNASTGSWQYSLNSTTWTAIGTVSTTSALLLASTNSIRFVPDIKDGGTATITYVAWDQTSGTVGTKASTTSTLQTSAFSSLTDSAQVIVTPLNDAPTLLTGIVSNTVTATEDTLFIFTGGNSITLADVDSGSNIIKLTLTLTGSGSYGFSSTFTGVGLNTDASNSPSLTGNTGSITLYGTQTHLNTAVGKLQYIPAANANQNNATFPTLLALNVDDLGYGVNGSSTGTGLTASKTITINITPVNDTPTLTVATGMFNVTKDTSANSVSNTITVADTSDIADSNYANNTYANPTLVITALHGTLSLSSNATHLTGVLSNNNQTLTLTGTESGANSLADINTALASGYLQYTPIAAFAGIDTLSLTFNDNGNAGGGNLSATGSISVVVGGGSSDNSAPSFGSLTTTPTFSENGSAVVLDGSATLTDSQLTVYNNWGGAVLTFARNTGANSDDVFGLTGTSNIGVNFNGSNIRIGSSNVGTFTNSNGQLQITFINGVTNTQANQILQAITYSNTSNDPQTSAIINYTLNDGNINTGTNPQGSGGPLSGTGSITVTIIPSNDAPTLTGLTAKSYTEDAYPVIIGSNAIPADLELSNRNDWGGATLTLSRNGVANAQDVFSASGTLSSLTAASGSFNNGSSALGTYTNSNGTLTLTFASGVHTSDVQAVMQEIAYSNSGQTLVADATSTVTLKWVLNDQNRDIATGGGTAGSGQDQGGGGALSVTQTQVITMTGVNDAPVISDTVLGITQTEDATAPSGVVGVLVSTLTGGITDVDSLNPTHGIAIIATDTTMGSWYYSTNNGTNWTALPTVSNIQALLLDASDRLYFQSTANVNGAVSAGLTVRAWDSSTGTSGNQSSAATNGGISAFSSGTDVVSLTVTAVNDAPTQLLTSVPLAAINEDQATTATDPTTVNPGNTVANLFNG